MRGTGIDSFNGEQFGEDIRVWLARHQHALRDLPAIGLPSSTSTLSRIQRGIVQPHAGLFLALCDLMQLEPIAYFVKEGADDRPAE